MSMDNDTRLAVLNMRNGAKAANAAPVRRRSARRYRRIAGSALTAFVLTLFTRGA